MASRPSTRVHPASNRGCSFSARSCSVSLACIRRVLYEQQVYILISKSVAFAALGFKSWPRVPPRDNTLTVEVYDFDWTRFTYHHFAFWQCFCCKCCLLLLAPIANTSCCCSRCCRVQNWAGISVAAAARKQNYSISALIAARDSPPQTSAAPFSPFTCVCCCRFTQTGGGSYQPRTRESFIKPTCNFLKAQSVRIFIC